MQDASTGDWTSTGRTARGGEGVERRTLLAGAAWTVPAVAMAAAAPVVTASAVTNVSFSQSSYSGTACSAVNGVQVFATSGGNPATGVSITATLSDGYTFDDGTTAFTGVTGSGGAVSLPPIKVPAIGGNGAVSATSSSQTASAGLLAPAVATAARWVYASGSHSWAALSSIPQGSGPAWADIWLNPSHQIVHDNNTLWTSGSVGARSYGFPYVSADDLYWSQPFIKQDGSASALRFSNNTTSMLSFPGVPVGSVPTWDQIWLTPSHTLVNDNGALWVANATNITSAGYPRSTGAYWSQPLVRQDGTFAALRSSNNNVAMISLPSVPAGSVPAWDNIWLTPSKTLVKDDGSLWAAGATNVKSFGFPYNVGSSPDWTQPFVLVDGSAAKLRFQSNAATWLSLPAVPKNSQPVWDNMWLTPSHTLVKDDGSVWFAAAQNVQAFGYPYTNRDGSWRGQSFLLAPAC